MKNSKWLFPCLIIIIFCIVLFIGNSFVLNLIHNFRERQKEETKEETNVEINEEIEVTKELRGEKLKEEILSEKEITVAIKELKVESNNEIIITGEITAYYNSQKYETFEVEILVDEKTVVLASVENKIEELKNLKERGDTLYITLRESEKQKGNLVADNIEVNGC